MNHQIDKLDRHAREILRQEVFAEHRRDLTPSDLAQIARATGNAPLLSQLERIYRKETR